MGIPFLIVLFFLFFLFILVAVLNFRMSNTFFHFCFILKGQESEYKGDRSFICCFTTQCLQQPRFVGVGLLHGWEAFGHPSYHSLLFWGLQYQGAGIGSGAGT